MIERLSKLWEDLKEKQRAVASMDGGAPGPLGHYFPARNCHKRHGMTYFKNLYSGQYKYGYCRKCGKFRYLTYL